MIYIWNLTHGGGLVRPSDEYRIQITGISRPDSVNQFRPEIAGKTLILGWWDDVGVFAGFDYTRHAGPLGSSPSIQIREEALHKATVKGFAPHNRGNGELAIAFRPEFIATYIQNLEALHECGESDREIEILDAIANDPAVVEEASIEENVAQQRQYAVVSTKRALRDINFRDRVLRVYGYQCTLCVLQLKLLDAAHILPVTHPDSTDETRNGVALCTLHHRAYDRGFVTFDTDYRVHLHEEMAEELRTQNLDGGLRRFREHLRPILSLPPDRNDRPHASFVAMANEMRGWTL